MQSGIPRPGRILDLTPGVPTATPRPLRGIRSYSVLHPPPPPRGIDGHTARSAEFSVTLLKSACRHSSLFRKSPSWLLEHIRQLFHGIVHVLNTLDPLPPPHPPHQQHHVEVGHVGWANDAFSLWSSPLWCRLLSICNSPANIKYLF